MRSNRLKIALALVVVLVIFSALSLLYWDIIRDTVVTPIYYLLWFGDLMLKSVPQAVFLALLIVVSLFISINTLSKVRTRRLAQERQRKASAGLSRYLEWKRLCDTQASNQFVRNQFTWEARKLTLMLLAYQEGIDAEIVEQRVKNGDLEVPDTIRALMKRQEIRVPEKAQGSFRNSIMLLRQWLLALDSADAPQSDPLADEIVAFIEQRLEISHAPEG